MIVAGVGFWGGSWLGVVRESPGWELAAIVDTDETALKRAASAVGLDRTACFSSVAAAASAVDADALLVAVPPAAHAPLAREALGHGFHCLIEKPFVTRLEDAQLLVDEARAAARVLMVSQQYRHRRGARTVAHLLRDGPLGKIGAVHVTFANELAVATGFQYRMEEPLLWEVAIHHFDLVRGVLGLEPTSVHATSWNPPWSRFEGNAASTAVLKTDSGGVVSYTGTLEPRGPGTGWDGVWEILCEHGAIHWQSDRVAVRSRTRSLAGKMSRRWRGHDWRLRRVEPHAVASLDRLGSLAELSAAIREGREPETSGRDNLRSLAVTLAAVESSQAHGRVEVRAVG